MKKRKILILLATILCLTIVLAGCSSPDNPKELIKDAFGNSEYNISFNPTSLSTPIDSIKYSANNIPKIPQPTKVGYIFEGWFFDKDFTEPYSDQALVMLMKDVTLHAKWNKEKFIHDGTYDIKSEAHILTETIKKKELVDKYGGYLDFSQCIDYKSTCIEKQGNNLMLRLVYDSGIVQPFGERNPFDVQIGITMDTNIYIIPELSIDPTGDSQKTLYIDIKSFNLDEPLLLEISYRNIVPTLANGESRDQTITTYTVEFDITNIIGFSEPYADINDPLEEGYYLAKSYFASSNNGLTMLSGFNPVYSYVYSDGKQNYKLIKQMIPYTGMVGSSDIQKYTERMIAFSPMQFYYDIDTPTEKECEVSSYLPETYNAQHYRNMEIEFHKNTGKIYNILDLGNDLSRSFMVKTAVTGFMELMDSMGDLSMILTIDYKNLIKLPEVDYKPLEGNNYEFNEQMCYYPGKGSDLNERNLVYDALTKYGFGTRMDNFYFSSDINPLADNNKIIYDSKITIKPTIETANMLVKDARYSIATFNVSSKIYGYDIKQGKNLYADSATIQTLPGQGGGTNQLRQLAKLKNGVSCKLGEKIQLAKQFAKKINSYVNFATVKYSAYEIIDGKVDFTKKTSVETTFNFNKEIAVLFEYGNTTAMLEFVEYQKPNIVNLKDANDIPIEWTSNGNGTYSTKSQLLTDKKYKLPHVTYDFMGNKVKMNQNFYLDDNGMLSIDPSTAACFEVLSGDAYIYHNIHGRTDSFVIPSANSILMYELKNSYGEREYIKFELKTDSKNTVSFVDENNKTIAFRNIIFDDNNIRYPLNASWAGEIIYEQFASSMVKPYKFVMPNYEKQMNIVGYSIYSNIDKFISTRCDIDVTDASAVNAMVDEINSKIMDKDYAVIILDYEHENKDSLEVLYLYNVTFDGLTDFKSVNHDAYFTNQTYVLKKPMLVGANHELIGMVHLQVYMMQGDNIISIPYGENPVMKVEDIGTQINLTFKQAGDYRIFYNYNLNYRKFPNSERFFAVIFTQDIKVNSDRSNVLVTYRTDSKHPFKDNELEKTVEYSLVNDIYTIKFAQNFDNTKFASGYQQDLLFGWTDGVDVYDGFVLSEQIVDNFITKYNTNHLVLNAIWDPTIEITYIKEYINSKGQLTTEEYSKEIFFINQDYFIHKGNYLIELPSIPIEQIQQGYRHIGWTGGFLGDKVFSKKIGISSKLPNFVSSKEKKQYFTIKSVIKQVFDVCYEVDYGYSNAMFADDKIIDGKHVTNINNKTNILCKKEGYKFVGWYDESDPTKTVIDLNTYKVTKHVTLIAKFEKIA